MGGTAGGAADGVARGAADVAVFQGAGLRSSKEELYLKESREEKEGLEIVEDCCASFSCEGRRFWFADAANQKEPASIRAGAATATTAAEPREAGGTGLVARPAGSGGGAASCAVGAADGAARVGGGVGVAGSGGWNCPGTTAVVGDGGRHGAEAGVQARMPPWPLAGSGVNPALYLAFSASGSAFQRWPGAWQGAGEKARAEEERSQRTGQDQGVQYRARGHAGGMRGKGGGDSGRAVGLGPGTGTGLGLQ